MPDAVIVLGACGVLLTAFGAAVIRLAYWLWPDEPPKGGDPISTRSRPEVTPGAISDPALRLICVRFGIDPDKESGP
jgi:hypothetical protein